MKEGKFNLYLIKRIRSHGLFAFKTADRFKPGVPDIYVEGGNWIESKVVKLGSQNRQINLFNKLTPEQKTFGDELFKTNDFLYIAFRLEFIESNRLWFNRFSILKNQPSYYINDLHYYSIPITKETEYPIKPLIDAMEDRK